MEGGIFQEATTTGIAVVLNGVTTLTTLMGDVWDVMVANPLLVVFLAASLLAVGIRVFRSVKRAAR